MWVAAHPGLYDPESRPPRLAGSRCDACGAVAFPAPRFGCDACGAPSHWLARAELSTRGVVHAVATMHRRGRDGAPPVTVAEIVLDDGPIIRATMRQPTAEGLRGGQRVHAVWAHLGRDSEGRRVVEPRFVPDEPVPVPESMWDADTEAIESERRSADGG